jgi:hypothetical protein
MPDVPPDFNYLAVLHELDKAVRHITPGADKVEEGDHQAIYRAKNIVSKITNFPRLWISPEEKISLRLGAEQKTLQALEYKVAARINKATDGNHNADRHRQLAGHWPPYVPLIRMVERFTALCISLSYDGKGGPFRNQVIDAYRRAVLPALAWGLMIRIYAHPKAQRAKLQEALGSYLEKGGNTAGLLMADGGKLTIEYLILVAAWHKALESAALGGQEKSTIVSLREELAKLMQMGLGELDTYLWENVGGQYLGTNAGSERARIVEEAHGAVFHRKRLALFNAARDERSLAFSNLIEDDLAKALKHPFDALTSPRCDHAAGTEACGAAFWLARACFGKHSKPQGSPVREASTQAVLLLAKAAAMFSNLPAKDDRLLTCLRYLAGIATNLRYARSYSVLHMQEQLVDLYVAHPQARKSLVAHFRGRVAWQNWHATNNPFYLKSSLDYYYKALHSAHEGDDGFDAETPIHFFPELTELQSQAGRDKGKEKKTLEMVDYITQRNYGVYFDIDEEKAKISAGLDDYKRYHVARLLQQHTSLLEKPTKGNEVTLAEYNEQLCSKATCEILLAIKGLHKELQLF